MSGMKLPETSTSFVNMSMSVEDCEEKCRSNCSCVGYALGDLKSGVGCVMWFGDLVDLRQYAEGGQDLFVRVSSSILENGGYSSHNKKPIALIVTLIVVPTFVVLLGCCLFFTWKKKLKNNRNRRAEERGKKERSQDLIFDKVLSSGPRDHHSHEQNSNEDFELPLIDLSTLAIATSNFNQGNKLGQGGFGSVFKGTLADGKEVAVKRLSKNSGQGGEEFKNEVLLIAKLQHRNLVRLLACCIEGDEKMLVYEYMQNKSLDCVIFNKVNSLSLDWRKRLNIIVGIARGLLYLHQDSRFRIIHRDLKASNVLLDGEMNPKISDFGMARIFGGDETEANTKRVVGTYGYMSPEYAMDGIFSIKSDVFSFGVLVLEIVSGKKNRGFYQSSSEHNLLGHAWRLWKEGKALELIDPAMADSCLEYEVLRCIQVGLLCVQERAEERPTMSTVVLMLSSESVAIAQPKQPGFCLVSTPFETESSSSKQDSCTVNHVTVTMLDAR
ncbi:hypothetical protein Scep_028617 [Stephania cephalantha]|uniref:non-specific serine/threonine protein kinase n=1 Tax=Stephania cephalantha TaxID=152367 RepID=A0AAP0HNL4_9MAGN